MRTCLRGWFCRGFSRVVSELGATDLNMNYSDVFRDRGVDARDDGGGRREGGGGDGGGGGRALRRVMIYKCPRFDERVVDAGAVRGEKRHQSIRQPAKAH